MSLCAFLWPKTTNPEPFDSGLLLRACKEFPNFCGPILLLGDYRHERIPPRAERSFLGSFGARFQGR